MTDFGALIPTILVGMSAATDTIVDCGFGPKIRRCEYETIAADSLELKASSPKRNA